MCLLELRLIITGPIREPLFPMAPSVRCLVVGLAFALVASCGGYSPSVFSRGGRNQSPEQFHQQIQQTNATRAAESTHPTSSPTVRGIEKTVSTAAALLGMVMSANPTTMIGVGGEFEENDLIGAGRKKKEEPLTNDSNERPEPKRPFGPSLNH